MPDIETVHENVDGEQITTKRVPHQGDVYEFEGEPGGEYEFTGEGTAPVAVREALKAHLGEGESVSDAGFGRTISRDDDTSDGGE